MKFDYSQLPPVDVKILDKFAHIRTADDMIKYREWINKTLKSPTSCSVLRVKDEDIVYRDQQDCILWRHGHCGEAVYVKHIGFTDLDNHPMHVAPNIPTFLARMYIENCIWRKVAHLKDADAERDYETIFAKKPIWLAYLNHYRALKKPDSGKKDELQLVNQSEENSLVRIQRPLAKIGTQTSASGTVTESELSMLNSVLARAAAHPGITHKEFAAEVERIMGITLQALADSPSVSLIDDSSTPAISR